MNKEFFDLAAVTQHAVLGVLSRRRELIWHCFNPRAEEREKECTFVSPTARNQLRLQLQKDGCPTSTI